MKYDRNLLIDLVKFYAVIALVPSFLLAPFFEPEYWAGLYLVVLVALLGISWILNSFLEWLNWPRRATVRATRRKARVVRRRKVK